MCLLNQPGDKDILTLYNTTRSSQLNPYLQVDEPPISMDYRFKSNHFVNSGGWYLNYLLSRLDGDTYDDVIDLIDRITSADKSGDNKWIIDNHINVHSNTMLLATNRLNSLGFNSIYDNTTYRIVSDNEPVVGYISHGIYSGFPSSYILDSLILPRK